MKAGVLVHMTLKQICRTELLAQFCVTLWLPLMTSLLFPTTSLTICFNSQALFHCLFRQPSLPVLLPWMPSSKWALDGVSTETRAWGIKTRESFVPTDSLAFIWLGGTIWPYLGCQSPRKLFWKCSPSTKFSTHKLATNNFKAEYFPIVWLFDHLNSQIFMNQSTSFWMFRYLAHDEAMR